MWGSNSRPWRYQHHALPTELTDQTRQLVGIQIFKIEMSCFFFNIIFFSVFFNHISLVWTGTNISKTASWFFWKKKKKKEKRFLTEGGHDHCGHQRLVKEVVSKTFIGYTYRMEIEWNFSNFEDRELILSLRLSKLIYRSSGEMNHKYEKTQAIHPTNDIVKIFVMFLLEF